MKEAYIDRKFDINVHYTVIDLETYIQYKRCIRITIHMDVEIQGERLDDDNVVFALENRIKTDNDCVLVTRLYSAACEAWLVGSDIYVYDGYDIINVHDSEIEI